MNKIFTILIASIFVFSCKDTSNNINVTIEGVPNGRKVTLKKQVDRKIINIDSTTVQNGKFSFNAKIEEPVILGVFIDSISQGVFPLLNVNDKVNIIGYKDSLYSSKISGSKMQDDLTELREMKLNLSKKMSGFTEEFQAARKVNDTAKINKINLKARQIQDEISLNEWSYIKSNPKSHVASMVLSGLFQDPKYKDSIEVGFNLLSKEVQNSTISKELKSYLEKLKVPVTPPIKAVPKK